MSQLHHFISLLNLTLKVNSFFFKIIKTKFILKLITLLIRHNYFVGYTICSFDSSKIIIFLKLNFNRNSPYMLFCKQVSNISRPIYIKYNQLKYSNSSLLILSTTKGIVTQKEALQLRLGGIILCKIF